jgi:hypothetical protein
MKLVKKVVLAGVVSLALAGGVAIIAPVVMADEPVVNANLPAANQVLAGIAKQYGYDNVNAFLAAVNAGQVPGVTIASLASQVASAIAAQGMAGGLAASLAATVTGAPIGTAITFGAGAGAGGLLGLSTYTVLALAGGAAVLAAVASSGGGGSNTSGG